MWRRRRRARGTEGQIEKGEGGEDKVSAKRDVRSTGSGVRYGGRNRRQISNGTKERLQNSYILEFRGCSYGGT